MLLVATGGLFFYHWIEFAVSTAHVSPMVEWMDMGATIGRLQEMQMVAGVGRSKGELDLAKADICLLAEQTGLGESAIESLWQQGRLQELLTIQKIYFAPVEIEAIKTTPLTISEWLAEEPVEGYDGMPMVDIRDGDILITKNSRFLGWRNGHAGLVVDAEEGLVLEAIMLGSPSQLCKVSKWESYPSFLVLRLKEEIANSSIPSSVASYAEEYLVGVPYQLLAGVFKGDAYKGQRVEAEDSAPISEVETVAAEALSGTQCAHLVWYAYRQFGIDLDSDGGLFVTPYDIQNSPYLEVIQVYGY